MTIFSKTKCRVINWFNGNITFMFTTCLFDKYSMRGIQVFCFFTSKLCIRNVNWISSRKAQKLALLLCNGKLTIWFTSWIVWVGLSFHEDRLSDNIQRLSDLFSGDVSLYQLYERLVKNCARSPLSIIGEEAPGSNRDLRVISITLSSTTQQWMDPVCLNPVYSYFSA